MVTNTDQLREIRDELISFSESPLYEYRTENGYHPVIGQGNHDARIMFIGEAPGENEAKTGVPFCGASGRVLDELLASIDLDRNDVYITNIVKDRPPENRDPRKDEIELYAPFLDRQIAIIQPEVIVTLGRFSMEYILKRYNSPKAKEKISALHGTLVPVEFEYGDVSVVPLFHPAASLYRREQRDVLFEDFKLLKQFVS